MTLRFLYLLVIFVSLAACSGGGGGGSDSSFAESPANTRTLAGFVEDGPVSGARVFLVDPATAEPARRCWASGKGRCETTTDDLGHFNFYLAQDADPADYLLVSEGGHDHQTGVSFEESGLQLGVPVAAFKADVKNLTLSPLTTLLNGLVKSGRPLASSLNRLSSWAGLGQQSLLLKRPSSSYPVLKRTLAMMALSLQLAENGSSAPWDDLRDHILGGTDLFDGSGMPDHAELQAAFSLTAEQATDLQSLVTQLGSVSKNSSAYRVFNGHMLSRLLSRELDGFLAAADAGFVATDPDYLANREILFKVIADAAPAAIPLWDWIPQKVLQHVLFNYQLITFAPFQVADPTAFEASLRRSEDGATLLLEADPRIAALVSGQSLFKVSLPLDSSEFLQAGDSLAKARYYYNSNISHLQRADDLALAVLDDQINDQLLVTLVEGTAENGMVKGWVGDDLFPVDMDLLIENRIMGSEFRGDAYVKLAQLGGEWGFDSHALTSLAKAEDYYQTVLDAKGVAFFANSDALNFRELAAGYLSAGDFSTAFSLLLYLHQSIAAPIDTPVAYNHAFSAGMSLADQLIASGDVAGATQVIDEMRQIALGCPADFSTSGTASYKSRVFQLVESARRYVRIGQFQNALDLYYGPGMIADLRLNDGLMSGGGAFKNKTGSYTVVYMDEMAQALFQGGDVAGAFGLLDSLSSSSRAKGYKALAASLAVQEAGQGGLEDVHPTEPAVTAMNALDLVFYRVPVDTFNKTILEAQIDALTYFVANRTSPYVALSLIEAGFDLEAVEVLEQATDLVRLLDDNLAKPYGLGHAKIDFGYAKIADLYIDLGLDQIARSLLNEAQVQVLPNLSDAGLTNKSLAALADVYLRLGDPVKAGQLLSLASQSFSPDAYDTLIDAMLRVHAAGVKEQVADYVQLLQSLYIPGAMSDGDLTTLVTNLVKASRYYSVLGSQKLARQTMELVREPALEIAVPSKRIDQLINWAEGYAAIDEFAKAQAVARLIEQEGSRASRNEALLAIGLVYAGRHDFGSDFDVAIVDLDRDGQPDFFNPLATQAEILDSGLVIDDDMDGDGIPDDQDARPLFFDSAQ